MPGVGVNMGIAATIGGGAAGSAAGAISIGGGAAVATVIGVDMSACIMPPHEANMVTAGTRISDPSRRARAYGQTSVFIPQPPARIASIYAEPSYTLS